MLLLHAAPAATEHYSSPCSHGACAKNTACEIRSYSNEVRLRYPSAEDHGRTQFRNAPSDGQTTVRQSKRGGTTSSSRSGLIRYNNPSVRRTTCSGYSNRGKMWSGPRIRTHYGVASWYGRKFHGRQTANGEVYNMYARTAAHKTLSFGTVVRVTNLRNGRQAIVRINDRGPFINGRDIDLSYGTACNLGMVVTGIEEVRLDILSG
jgi:rare lipoprotein A (peptidoglycan hydrolase)